MLLGLLKGLLQKALLDNLFRERKSGKNQLHMPLSVPILGVFMAVFGGFMTYGLSVSEEPFRLSLIGIFFFPVGLYAILLGIFFRIRWDAKGFTVLSFLGISQRYSYTDLRGFTETNESYTLFLREKTVRIVGIEFYAAAFLKACKKEYAAIHHDQPLPYRPHIK